MLDSESMSNGDDSARLPRSEPTFEQALSRLDDTVRALEEGGLTLDEATRLFEDGMKLARTCGEMLASAEIRVTRIRTAYGEQMNVLEEDNRSTSGYRS